MHVKIYRLVEQRRIDRTAYSDVYFVNVLHLCNQTFFNMPNLISVDCDVFLIKRNFPCKTWTTIKFRDPVTWPPRSGINLILVHLFCCLEDQSDPVFLSTFNQYCIFLTTQIHLNGHVYRLF